MSDPALKHLWTDGTDTYVAHDVAELNRLRDVAGSESDADDWCQIDDATPYRMWNGEHGEPGIELVEKLAGEWAAQSDPGFLGSTEC